MGGWRVMKSTMARSPQRRPFLPTASSAGGRLRQVPCGNAAARKWVLGRFVSLNLRPATTRMLLARCPFEAGVSKHALWFPAAPIRGGRYSFLGQRPQF